MGVLSLVILALLQVVVRLENFHYASWTGACLEEGVVYAGNPEANAERNKCLEQEETRTSDVWHLYYALGGQ